MIAIILGFIVLTVMGFGCGTQWQAHRDYEAQHTPAYYNEQGAADMIRLGVIDWTSACGYWTAKTKPTADVYTAIRGCHIDFHVGDTMLTKEGRK